MHDAANFPAFQMKLDTRSASEDQTKLSLARLNFNIAGINSVEGSLTFSAMFDAPGTAAMTASLCLCLTSAFFGMLAEVQASSLRIEHLSEFHGQHTA